MDVALFTSGHGPASVIDLMRFYLSRELAERTALHGVFMDVLGLGVFITGDPAPASQSSRSNSSRVATDWWPTTWSNSRGLHRIRWRAMPRTAWKLLEVRGIGIQHSHHFGETARRRKMQLKLIVYLQRRPLAKTT